MNLSGVASVTGWTGVQGIGTSNNIGGFPGTTGTVGYAGPPKDAKRIVGHNFTPDEIQLLVDKFRPQPGSEVLGLGYILIYKKEIYRLEDSTIRGDHENMEGDIFMEMVFNIPFKDVALLINHRSLLASRIFKWRMEIGK